MSICLFSYPKKISQFKEWCYMGKGADYYHAGRAKKWFKNSNRSNYYHVNRFIHHYHGLLIIARMGIHHKKGKKPSAVNMKQFITLVAKWRGFIYIIMIFMIQSNSAISKGYSQYILKCCLMCSLLPFTYCFAGDSVVSTSKL